MWRFPNLQHFTPTFSPFSPEITTTLTINVNDVPPPPEVSPAIASSGKGGTSPKARAQIPKTRGSQPLCKQEKDGAKSLQRPGRE